MRKSIFSHLYTWVLLAIILGALVGYFYPRPAALYLTAEAVAIAPPTLASGKIVKSSDVPKNILAAIERERPGLEVDDVILSAGPNPVYTVTFDKTIGPVVKALGDGFIKLIRMLVTPIIFTTV